jgi:hypothetical protein
LSSFPWELRSCFLWEACVIVLGEIIHPFATWSHVFLSQVAQRKNTSCLEQKFKLSSQGRKGIDAIICSRVFYVPQEQHSKKVQCFKMDEFITNFSSLVPIISSIIQLQFVIFSPTLCKFSSTMREVLVF